MKKLIFVVLLIVIIILIILKSGDLTDIDIATPVIIKDGDILPEDLCKNLDTVVVIEKTGCPACATAKPRLKAVEEELGLEFDYYDTAVAEERTELLALGFVPTHVPTIVVDCKVYGGVFPKEAYKEIIGKWLVA